ncbi:MAG: DUF2796 domain-containing protein [Nitrosomonadales bacterium]|nr:DUF2796 domain-containing protein [Nitrosomonadales bacterium]
MRSSLRFLIPLALASLSIKSVAAHELGPHVHGVASLQVAVDGNILTLDFSGPLDNLLGFEHAPRDDKQKAAVKNMVETLHHTDGVFAPSPAANCTSVSVKLESSVLEAKLTSSNDGHADIDGEYVFRCGHPENLHGLELKLFDSFHNLHQVEAQVAGPHTQTAARLSPAQRNLSW